MKLIKCARIYGLRLEMKRINRGPKMDGCWKMMMPGTAGLVGVEGWGRVEGVARNCFRGGALGGG